MVYFYLRRGILLNSAAGTTEASCKNKSSFDSKALSDNLVLFACLLWNSFASFAQESLLWSDNLLLLADSKSDRAVAS